MKKILIFGFVAFFCLQVFSQETGKQKINWLSIQEAEKLTKENPRKIIIDVYTDWCGWCVRMDQSTFGHPGIAGYINEHYYAVKFNAETRDSIVFAGQVYKNHGGNRQPNDLAVALLQGKMSYPSIAYMNEKLQLITVVPGYYTAEQIEPILVYIADEAYLNTDWKNFQANFTSNIFKAH